MKKVRLIELADARSGDKNNRCNIGVLAKSPDAYHILQQHLTEEVVREHFKGLSHGPVRRYEWAAIEALNFVLEDALDGGGALSMRMDTLGKNFSAHLLRLELEIPANAW